MDSSETFLLATNTRDVCHTTIKGVEMSCQLWDFVFQCPSVGNLDQDITLKLAYEAQRKFHS